MSKTNLLELVIESGSDSYGIGEEVLIRYTLRNVGKEKVLINKDIVPGGNLLFELTDKNGQKTTEPCVMFELPSWEYSNIMGYLKPGASLKGRAAFRPNARPYVEGRYVVKATLRMYVSEKAGERQFTPKYEIESNAISLALFYKDLFGPVGSGDIKRAREMLESGADVNITDSNGNTPLHRVRSPEMAELLIRAGADLGAQNDRGLTPLHSAVWSPDLIRVLIKNDADVNSRSKYGETPLHFAASRVDHGDDLEVIEELIKSGADINAKDDDGRTPLDWVSTKMVIDALKAFGARKG